MLPYPGWGEETVRFPAHYFEEGRLPGVCAVTGTPATTSVRRRFSTTPAWVGCLILVNFLLFLVALVATNHSATGDLPVCTAVAKRVRRQHQDVVSLTSVGVIALVAIIPAAIILSSARYGWVGVVALAAMGVVALAGAAVADRREAATLGIQGRVVTDGFGDRWIQLRGVHPAFSRAVVSSLGR